MLGPGPEERTLPFLPLRDVLIVPGMLCPLFVGRVKSLGAISAALRAEPKTLFVVPQRRAKVNDPVANDCFALGTIAFIVHALELPDKTTKILLQGVRRARVLSVDVESYVARVLDDEARPPETTAEMQMLKSRFAEYVSHHRRPPPELLASLERLEDGRQLFHTALSHVALPLPEKVRLFELDSVSRQCEELSAALVVESAKLELENQIRERVKEGIARAKIANPPDEIERELRSVTDEWARSKNRDALRLRLLGLLTKVGKPGPKGE